MNSNFQRLDFVTLLHPAHNGIAARCLPNLVEYALPGRILLITARDNFDFCSRSFLPLQQKGCTIEILDENETVPGLSKVAVASFLKSKGADPGRAGWYFQQFLKMGVALRADLSPHYVIWDADTILLRPLTFLDEEGHSLVAPSKECHPPYFKTLERLLSIPRLTSYSFISEHLVIETEVMRSLIHEIEVRHPSEKSWVWAILNAVDAAELSRSGFSEYETYGNYLLQKKPDAVRQRKLSSLRRASRFYSPSPSQADLLLLAMNNTYATFETWQPANPLRFLVHRMISLVSLPVSLSYAWLAKRRRARAAF